MPVLRLRFSSFLISSLLLLTSVTTVRADLVTDWNAQALSAMQTTTVAPIMSRDLSILHTAIYNAAESIRGAYNTYGFGSYAAPGSGPTGASIDAAMASSANTVMQSLYGGSGSSFTTLYNTQIGAIAPSQAKTDGIAWGAAIANSMLSWRSTDGASAASSTPFSPVGTAGYWQQTSAAAALLPGWGNVNTFAIAGTSGYTSALPGGAITNYLQSSQYAADYNQVQQLGSSNSTLLPDQVNQAYFWAAPAGSVQVPGMWNQIAQSVAISSGLLVTDSARLFAAMNVAMADAGIVSFANAYDQQFWRPETAIANGNFDGNASTVGDELWHPLIDSPSYPEYTAAGSAFSSAASTVLGSYLGNNNAFSLSSDIDGNGTNDLTRVYSSFSQAANEASISGVYRGTQFMTSITQGQAMGADVAGFVLSNNFALVPEPSGALLVLLGFCMFVFGNRRRF